MLYERALFAEPGEPGGYDMAQDPVNVRAITVKMDDGGTYTVFDRAETSTTPFPLAVSTPACRSHSTAW